MDIQENEEIEILKKKLKEKELKQQHLQRQLKWYESEYYKLMGVVAPIINIAHLGDDTREYELVWWVKSYLEKEVKYLHE
jgi:hypothetical protein